MKEYTNFYVAVDIQPSFMKVYNLILNSVSDKEIKSPCSKGKENMKKRFITEDLST